MAHTFINENLLTPDEVKILHEADSAPYAFGNYACLGDLHANVTVEISDKEPLLDYPLPDLTPEEIAKHIRDFYSYLRKMVGKGADYIEDIDQCFEEMWRMSNMIAFDTKEFPLIRQEIEYLHALWSNRDKQQSKSPMKLGCYFPQTNKVELYICSIRSVSSHNAVGLLAATYAHEMGHAYYADNAKTQSDTWKIYLEEPLAELFSLRFAEVFDKTHAGFLKNTQDDINRKKWNPSVCYYGFGAAVYESGMITPEMYHDSVARPFTKTSDVKKYIQPFQDGFYPFVEEGTYVRLLFRILNTPLANSVLSTNTHKTSSATSPDDDSATQDKNSNNTNKIIEPMNNSSINHQSNTLLDNSVNYSMADYIKSMLLNPMCTEVKIATGYWDLPGMKVIYSELKSFLERGGKLDLLIGEEPPVRQYQLDTKQTRDENFPDFYIRRDIQRLNEDYIDVAQLLIDFSDPQDEDNSQIRVHVYGKKEEDKFLHAKCYIFLGQGFANGVIGSSNFTQKGLQENAELNYLETNTLVVTATNNLYTNTKSHLTWFMEKWDEGEPWTGVFIQIINTLPGTSTPQPLTPYEVYIRLLQDRFGTIVDETMDEVLKTYLDGTIYKPLDYQLDAVKELYWKMQDMGGFLLADVVGLGKTICGILLAKYHLEHTSRSKKVLIITPPAIQSSWKETIDEFNKGSHSFKLVIGKDIDFVTTGSIEKIADAELADSLDDYNNSDDDSAMSSIDTNTDYSLILIDESHKFRNNNTKMYNDLQNVIEGICERTQHYPYVGLLSATPQNNRPYDLLNQILLFEHEPERSHFDRIPNRDLRAFFKRINDEYKIARQLPPQQANQILINLAQEVRDKVLECIMVRRTRTDIQSNYNSGLVFPDIIGPVKLEYKMDPQLATAFSNTMNAIGMGGTLQYARYRAIEELKPQLQRRYTYGSMTAKKSADSLARIVQMLLVKRLESSFDAFRKSLANQKQAIGNMLQMIADDCIFICPDLDVNTELDIAAKQAKHPNKTITYQTCYDDIRVRIQRLTQEGKNVRSQNAEYHAADFSHIAQYQQNLQDDLAIIDGLISDWQQVTTDPKLDEFCARLQNDIMKSDSVRIGRHLQELTFELAKAIKDKNGSLEDSIREEIKRIHSISVKVATNNDLERKLVIFSEAIDTVKRLEKECVRLGFRVLTITAENREREKDNIRLNFDANVPTNEQQNQYDIIITTEVLAEGINLHRANAIVNYDSPWNATKLIQRIGRVNRIGSKAAAVFVYNFHPSAQGNDIIALVENAYAKLQSFHIMFGEDNAIFSDTEQVVSYATSINGTASPLQAFLLELRNYKKSDPSRYNQIASAPLNQLQIATDAQGLVALQNQETLCAIRQKETSYVLVDANMKARVVSTLEAFQACQCGEKTTSIALPANIFQIQQTAEQELINYQNKLSAQQRSAKVYIDALTAIRQLQTTNLTPQAQQDLSIINGIVRGGNSWVARKIGKLGADIVAKQHSTVPYTQADIEQTLHDIISKVQLPNTIVINPTHFITFCKI